MSHTERLNARGVSALVAALLLALLFAPACRSTTHGHIWEERYLVAARAHDRGEYDIARAHYEQLAQHAPDQEHARLISYRLGLMHQDRGQIAEALASYRALYEAPIADEHGARAMWRAVQLLDELPGRDQEAEALYGELLERFGDWVAAEHAVSILSKRAKARGGPQLALAELERYREGLEGKSALGAYLLEVASLWEQNQSPQRALQAYDEILARPGLKALWDDALWEQARLHRLSASWPEAIAKLERLATEFQETSWFIGDYSSEHADEARMELGRIYLEELHEPREAIAQFERFLRDFEHNKLRDDAAWGRLEALKQAGETRAYAKGLKRFVRDYPESRYVRHIVETERAEALSSPEAP